MYSSTQASSNSNCLCGNNRGIREWYRNLQIASDMGAHIKQRKLFLGMYYLIQDCICWMYLPACIVNLCVITLTDFKHEYQFTATASGYVAPKTKDKLGMYL